MECDFIFSEQINNPLNYIDFKNFVYFSLNSFKGNIKTIKRLSKIGLTISNLINILTVSYSLEKITIKNYFSNKKIKSEIDC